MTLHNAGIEGTDVKCLSGEIYFTIVWQRVIRMSDPRSEAMMERHFRLHLLRAPSNDSFNSNSGSEEILTVRLS